MTTPLTADPTNTVTMEMNENAPAFDIVLRGYERRQVDEHLATARSPTRA